MHACGHDLHMAALVATADIMATANKPGTAPYADRPARRRNHLRSKEDDRDGLFTRFPSRRSASLSTSATSFPPDKLHHPGVYDANADSLRITIYGKGGHGAAPNPPSTHRHRRRTILACKPSFRAR